MENIYNTISDPFKAVKNLDNTKLVYILYEAGCLDVAYKGIHDLVDEKFSLETEEYKTKANVLLYLKPEYVGQFYFCETLKRARKMIRGTEKEKVNTLQIKFGIKNYEDMERILKAPTYTKFVSNNVENLYYERKICLDVAHGILRDNPKSFLYLLDSFGYKLIPPQEIKFNEGILIGNNEKLKGNIANNMNFVNSLSEDYKTDVIRRLYKMRYNIDVDGTLRYIGESVPKERQVRKENEKEENAHHQDHRGREKMNLPVEKVFELKSKGLSQRQIAASLNISTGSVWKILNNKR